VDSAKKLLLLFDEKNIRIYWMTRKKLKDLRRLIQESETWITESEIKETKLKQTLETIEFFIGILFKSTTIDNHDQIIHNPYPEVANENNFSSIISILGDSVDPVRQEMLQHLNAYQFIT